MVIIQKSILGLTGLDYYTYHLGIINSFLKEELTPKEREVLGAFMSFKGELVESNRFETLFRKKVREILNISHGGLSNYLKALKDKGAIVEGEDGILKIVEELFPTEPHQFYQFKITR